MFLSTWVYTMCDSVQWPQGYIHLSLHSVWFSTVTAVSHPLELTQCVIQYSVNGVTSSWVYTVCDSVQQCRNKCQSGRIFGFCFDKFLFTWVQLCPVATYMERVVHKLLGVAFPHGQGRWLWSARAKTLTGAFFLSHLERPRLQFSFVHLCSSSDWHHLRITAEPDMSDWKMFFLYRSLSDLQWDSNFVSDWSFYLLLNNKRHLLRRCFEYESARC